MSATDEADTDQDFAPRDQLGEVLQASRSYRVGFSDCCVEGEFTAEVVDLVVEDDAGADSKAAITQVVFGNGVTLCNWSGVTFIGDAA